MLQTAFLNRAYRGCGSNVEAVANFANALSLRDGRDHQFVTFMETFVVEHEESNGTLTATQYFGPLYRALPGNSFQWAMARGAFIQMDLLSYQMRYAGRARTTNCSDAATTVRNSQGLDAARPILAGKLICP